MASSLNRVTIIGNLGADPEVRTFQSGGKVCNLRVACSEVWRDKSTGERRERTEWVSVSIFAEHAVRFAEQYLRKGSKVYVEGKLETRKWTDQQGQDRYTTEVTVRPYGGEIMGLDKPEGGQGGGYGSGGEDRAYGGYGGSRPSLDDDEIPF
ncbi:single-stranded DNA-binding protein [Celeribacter sp. SCSIO 80788]|uniref:single-stranded DNA-binding protein n=1 Tax=Celeribacter sp. SCSIO 80788 TaxID=3117013 RepID=UPI003DA626FB